jgi:hypothetical protein
MEVIKKAIIETLEKWDGKKSHYDHDIMECSGIWFGYKALAKDTGFELKKLKKAMKELSNENKVQQLYTSSDESRIAGSGWFLS